MNKTPRINDDIVGLVLSDDLIFTSRIVGSARALAFTFQAARNVDLLKAKLATISPRCIILDLGNDSLDLASFFAFLKEKHLTPRVVAFGSHVDTAGLAAANAAGCDPVLARSKFAEELPILLPQWLAV